MAKRELSSTLRNLKFMQRAVPTEEKAKTEEEVIPDGNFPSSSNPKRCKVIMEGDPYPGVTKGRMSFQSFNPSIEKLNEEASNPRQPEVSTTSSGNQNGIISDRDEGSSRDGSDNLEVDGLNGHMNGDHKRKQAGGVMVERYPNKSQNINKVGQESSPNGNRSSHKQPKREKLDWSVLRPPKNKSKRN